MSDDESDDREAVPNDVLASGQLLCAGCGTKTEAVRSVEDERARPKLDDRTLCWTCGAVSIYARTSLGYWHLRAPDDDERAEIDGSESVRQARAELTAAKRAGRGPSSIGHSAGGAPPPPAPLVVVPVEPVSWQAAAERHGLTAGEVAGLRRWVEQNVGARPRGPGVVEVACGACELPAWLSPAVQQAVFAGARVLCVPCVVQLQQRFGEGGS